jgi:16S rRNA (cytosine967-C5)-methyltransferase
MAEAARQRAVRVLAAVLPARGGGESLRAVLARERPGLAPAEQGLMADLAFGVCRHYRLLEYWLHEHMKKPLRPGARSVELALMAGLYEVWFSERARHAVLNAWPDVCRALNAAWAAGLCNALLRRANDQDRETYRADRPPEIRYSAPDWLWQALQQDWPDQAEALLARSNDPPPLALRVNAARTRREHAAGRLEAAGFETRAGELSPDCLYIEPARPVQQLPGFAEGEFSVQDEAAQLPVTLMDVPAGGRILDACAAPGGKTAQLAEHCPGARITALEADPERLPRVRDNLERLALEAALVQGDATDPDSWWDGELFDAVLIDAPCSASGILRRQPDSKWHRQPADLEALVRLQGQILVALWRLLKPGGALVYATCSVLKSENEDQVQHFLAAHADARDDTPEQKGAVPSRAGCQLHPAKQAQDGFFFARLAKSGEDFDP